MHTFLAIDLGLRHGFACYQDDGTLLWYKSSRFPSKTEIKKTAYKILKDIEGLTTIIIEGDKAIGQIWEKVALKLGMDCIWVSPEVWRAEVLHKREQRSGKDAKKHALDRAERIIAEHGIKRPVRLRDDEAEAILIGQWHLSMRL